MLETPGNPIRALTDPLLDSLFRQPSRLGVESAWYGHVPFAMWLVEHARPRVLVELGTHAGVSYSAFCDAILEQRLPTSCFAIDTWRGDQHAGFYDDDVYEDFKRFNELHYRNFSRLLRMTFDEALATIGDGTIDLLHIDGLHSYDAVRHDFESWLPKLTDRAIVLFHDTNVRERDFGVWRLWQDLRQVYPGFEFLHASGLGVLAVGRNVPQSVLALCSLDADAEITQVRARFSLLGERWETGARLALLESGVAQMMADTQEQQAASQAEWAASERTRKRLQAEFDTAYRELRRLRPALAGLHQKHEDLLQERQVILNSTLWRMTNPLRRLGRAVPPPIRRSLRSLISLARKSRASSRKLPAAATSQVPDSTPKTIGWRIVVISGEPHNPGHCYRVVRFAEAAKAIGAAVLSITLAEVADQRRELAEADLVMIWRAAYAPDVALAIEAVRAGKGKLLADIDDLMFVPELASEKFIDGIRSQDLVAVEVAAFFQRVREVLAQADACSCTTNALATHMRQLEKVTFVLPNGFDADTHAVSRLAVRRRRAGQDDGLLRIGYAGGTRTHQRDFAPAAEALGRILHELPTCRLVLFRDQAAGRDMLDAGEFPALQQVAGQIEWRDLVPLAELPNEMARFDINLAPLETGNAFCEAKSELKYFEAALVGVCTVASPTAAMRQAIRHGETGWLADRAEEWYSALRELIDDAGLRHRLAHAAYLDVLWRYGPVRRQELVLSMLQQIRGGPDAARAFELQWLRDTGRARQFPDIPATDVLFVSDKLGIAEVTVTIPLYNYAMYVEEALESVRAQTLPSIDLVVVDDSSTDNSLDVAMAWVRQHADRFNRVLVMRNQRNSGLARTRNAGFDAAETAFVLPLDADNRLRPTCCETSLAVLKGNHAAFAYPRIQCFGGSHHVIGEQPFTPLRFASSNYIDAMALVAKWAWASIGGYEHIEFGWEDYDFWCRCIERGAWGVHIPEILADYRFHESSMQRTATDIPANKKQIVSTLESRHPWLSILPE